MPFKSLGLPDAIVRNARAAGYKTPTPVQERAIPTILAGHDLVAAAQTGSGKTAAFLMPILARLIHGPRAVRALVLVPTRELAAQVDDCAHDYGRHTGVRSGAVYGGVPIAPQERMLCREGVELLVATPGRLLDLHERQRVALDEVEVLVLDEADRMVDMGFAPDLKRILRLLPKSRQTLLFSATMPPKLNEVARDALREPVRLDLAPPSRPAASIAQAVYPVPRHLKPALLNRLLADSPDGTAIVFTRTKHGADRLARRMAKHGHKFAVLHGDRTQGQRERAMRDFRSGRLSTLVATDIASRGIDVDDVTHVINYDVPNAPEDYVHRIGRTGRMDAAGDALTLLSPEERDGMKAIERFLGTQLPRVMLHDFDYHRSAADDPFSDRERGGRREARSERQRKVVGSEHTPVVQTVSGPAHGRRRQIGAGGRRGRRRM
jgi:ATP-dependent RNA helicase RhlE